MKPQADSSSWLKPNCGGIASPALADLGCQTGPVVTDHKFTGQKLDATGFYYYNARYYDPEIGQFISPDTVVPEATNLFDYNRYMYVRGQPMRLTDNSGHVWETVLDAAAVGYDIYDIYNNGLSWESGLSLAADVGGLVVPFVPSAGACVRWCDEAVQYGDEAVEYGSKAVNYVGDKVDEGWQATKEILGMGDEATSVTKVGADCLVNSFSGDTLVMTPSGLKPIAELVEGELVLAYNENTGEIGAYPIVDTIAHVDPEIVLLTIDDETLETTAEHPFYELESAPWLVVGQTTGRWTDALDLQAGDRIWKADGTSSVVQSVEVAPVQQQMYNLTVAEAHTFFVGQDRWLVHNGGPCGILNRPFANNADLNKNMIEEMFRGAWNNGQWVSHDLLPGGLAGAIRHELANPGTLVGGRSHITKGQDRLNGLKRILEDGVFKGQKLDQHDLDIVRRLHDDLLNALQGK